MENIGPGLYLDADDVLHVDADVILGHFGIVNDARGRKQLLKVLNAISRDHWNNCPVIIVPDGGPEEN